MDQKKSEVYESVVLLVTEFDKEDVITTSLPSLEEYEGKLIG